MTRLESAPARCDPDDDTPAEEARTAVCSSECRGFYDDINANCPSEVHMYIMCSLNNQQTYITSHSCA